MGWKFFAMVLKKKMEAKTTVMQRRVWMYLVACLLLAPIMAYGAYHHGGDTDSETVLEVFPEVKGTKLDSCALCHTGGSYQNAKGRWISMGSCQWCHYESGYDEEYPNFHATLNSYGEAFNYAGKDKAALNAIRSEDADGDGFSNEEEMAALRFPGDENDDPTKVTAPYRVYTRAQLESMHQHTQMMLMNTHKSGDFYAEYSGVPIARLLNRSGILDSATGMEVIAADGWSQYHPLEIDDDPLLYHVYGPYPQANYFYEQQADKADNQDGWCDYTAITDKGYVPYTPIHVRGGLQMLLAIKRNGDYLQSSGLTIDNKLDGEGPYRVVPPQKYPEPPDQSSKSTVQEVIWPFDYDTDHNAGFSTRAATMIKVEPLPPGTTDIDTLEAGWQYVDEGKIIVYGAVDPKANIKQQLRSLKQQVGELAPWDYKRRSVKRVLKKRLANIIQLVRRDRFNRAEAKLAGAVLPKIDGCLDALAPDLDDWVTNCEEQRKLYWAAQGIVTLLQIER